MRTRNSARDFAEAQIKELRYVIEHGLPTPSSDPVDWIFMFRSAFPLTNSMGRQAAIDAFRAHPDHDTLTAQFHARWPEVADIPLSMELPDA